MRPWSFDVKIQRIKGECTMMKATVAGISCYCDPWQSQITEQEKTSVIFYTLLLETCNNLIQTEPVRISSLQSEKYKSSLWILY